MARKKKAEAKATNGNDANLGYEAELFKAADKLRGNMEPSDYKHVALGLIFLKHISDSFEAKHTELLGEYPEGAEDPDEYLAENVFWVPQAARWSHLRANAKQPGIGKLIDEAMLAIEKDNDSLKGVLPKDYARPALNPVMLGELIDLISGIALGETGDRSRDVLGRVYEYFLGQFAGSEGKRGGEFYTPRSVVKVLVEMLEPYQGRVYDPCCGSGGMFVQSEKFVEAHGGRIGDIAIYGQESNYTTWRLCKMNLAVRGIDADIRWNSEGSFHKDELADLRADVVLANPPFNISDWGGDRLRDDARWQFGIPPAGNANFVWLQHILSHLSPTGTAGVVLANGSMSSTQSGEGEIRRAMIDGNVVDCMIALPGQLFYSTQIPACLWFLARDRSNGVARNKKLRDRRGEILFIDARKLGHLVDRTRREFSEEDVAKVAETYHRWREGHEYEDVPGFCKSATRDEIKDHGYVLTPGRYVGAENIDIDDTPFTEKIADLKRTLEAQLLASQELDAKIRDTINQVFPMRRLVDVAEFMSGGTPKKGVAEYWDGDIPWYSARNMNQRFLGSTNITITDAGLKAGSRIAPEGATLLLVRGSGLFNHIPICFADRPVAFNQGVKAICPKRNVDPIFLHYWIEALRSTLRDNLEVTGIGAGKFDVGFLQNLPFPDLSEQEQEAIGLRAAALDRKIDLNRQMNETLEAMAQAIFKDWFVDFGPTRAKMEGREAYLAREIWDLFPDRLDDEGKPVGWEVRPVGDVIELLDSKRVPLSSRERKQRPGRFPYHGATGVMDFIDDYLFDERLLLIGEDGSVIRTNGKPFTQYVWGKVWVNNHAHVVHGPDLSVEQLKCFFDIVYIGPYVTGAVQQKLNQRNLKRIPFVYASSRLHEAFDTAMYSMFARIRSNSEESTTLVRMRDLLLPKLMSGEFRIPKAEHAAEELT